MRYLGHLSADDPLYGYLRDDIFPQIGVRARSPGFRVYQLPASNHVYLYEDEHSQTRVIGKFFGGLPGLDPRTATRHMDREFSNLTYLRSIGFTGYPHYVARPLGRNASLNNVLVEEFCYGTSFATFIVNGKVPGILNRAMAGEEVGTLFPAAKESLPSRKHWIAYTLRPKGRILVDEGARTVLSQHGRSLLPSGVVRVEGEFDRGDCVRVCGADGTEFARGLAAYAHGEAERLLGHNSSEIEAILGYKYGDEIIHRDNLVVL